MPLYHHCISLENVVHGEITPDKEHSDKDFQRSYDWLEKQVGFYPLFMAVGISDEDKRMTGYPDNWRVRTGTHWEDDKLIGTYRKKDEFPNHVLFSFDQVDGIYTDFDYWHIVLNSMFPDTDLSDYDRRLIFKPSWPRSRWLKKARDKPRTVQLVTPYLDLSQASEVWVRNKQTQQHLIDKGFDSVVVKRLTLE